MCAHKAAKLVKFDLALRFGSSNDIVVSEVKQIFYHWLDLCKAAHLNSDLSIFRHWLVNVCSTLRSLIGAAVKSTAVHSRCDLLHFYWSYPLQPFGLAILLSMGWRDCDCVSSHPQADHRGFRLGCESRAKKNGTPRGGPAPGPCNSLALCAAVASQPPQHLLLF